MSTKRHWVIFSKNLEEPSPTENEEEIDEQTRSMVSPEIQCVREKTGVIFVQTLVHCSFQTRSWWNNTRWHRVNPGAKYRSQSDDSTTNIQRIRDEAGECHGHTPVRDFDHRSRRTDRSQTYWKVQKHKQRERQTRGRCRNTTPSAFWNSLNNVGHWKWRRRQAWTWWNLEQRHGDWYSPYGHNTLTTRMISGSLLHERVDEHNQLPDESKDQKQTEDLAGIQANIMCSRSCFHDPWTNIRRSFVTNTMRSRRPWQICRSYNIMQSWERKLTMNSSGEESCRWLTKILTWSMLMWIRDKWFTKRTTISSFGMTTCKNTRIYKNRSKHTSHQHRKCFIRRSRNNLAVWVKTHTGKHFVT